MKSLQTNLGVQYILVCSIVLCILQYHTVCINRMLLFEIIYLVAWRSNEFIPIGESYPLTGVNQLSILFLA